MTIQQLTDAHKTFRDEHHCAPVECRLHPRDANALIDAMPIDDIYPPQHIPTEYKTGLIGVIIGTETFMDQQVAEGSVWLR